MNSNRCICCFKQDCRKSLTQEHLQYIKEIIGEYSDSLNPIPSSVICSICHNKLRELVNFKLEIFKTHQKFLQITEIKSEPQEDPEEEISIDLISQHHKLPETEIIKEEQDYSTEPITIINGIEHCFTTNIKRKQEQSKNKKLSKRGRKKTVPSEQDHFCSVCNKYFAEVRQVREHYKRIHLKTKNYFCDICDYSSYKKYDIFLHIINNHKSKSSLQKNSICPTCGLAFYTNSHLSNHIMRKHLRSSRKKILCDLCGHKTPTLNEMRSHMNIHYSKELREKYSCEICKAIFCSKGSLKKHRDVQHLHLNEYTTCFCGKTFKHKVGYQRHYAVIHMGQKNYKCDVCNKSFSRKIHVENHKKQVHGNIVPNIPCEICGTLYKSLETLKRHMIYHEDPKFKCNECGKMFHENKKLMDHQSAHKVLQFPCQYCERSFRLETQINAHLKKVHFKEKLTFRCELCSSTFTRKSTYRDHALRQHKELSQEVMTEFLKKIRNCLAEEQKS